MINDVDTYEVGQSVDISKYADSEDGVHIQINYDANGLVPETASSTLAQTGDVCAIAVIALALISLATAAFISRRKKESF